MKWENSEPDSLKGGKSCYFPELFWGPICNPPKIK